GGGAGCVRSTRTSSVSAPASDTAPETSRAGTGAVAAGVAAARTRRRAGRITARDAAGREERPPSARHRHERDARLHELVRELLPLLLVRGVHHDRGGRPG